MTIAPKSMKFFFKILETVRLIYIFSSQRWLVKMAHPV